MDESFIPGELRPYDCARAADMEAIIAGTRLVTPVEGSIWESASRALTSAIDPDNVLQAVVKTGKYRFTEDNVVVYQEMVADEVEG